VLAALALVIFLGCAIAPPGLMDDADSAHAEVAREMAESGDYVTLQMDGIKYYEKDPLMYWLIAGSFRAFGVNEFAARLPLALSMVFAVLAVWTLASSMFGSRAGFYAGLVLATSVGPFLFTRILIPDILITALITCALCFIVRGLDNPTPKPRVYLGFYAACGLAFLTKGMIGVVFPASIVFLFLLADRRLGELMNMRLWSGIAIFLAVVLPWNVIACLRNEHFFWFHFINEQVYRYLGKRYPKDYDTVPTLLFYALHALWMFPWVFFLPGAIRYVPRHLTMSREQKMTALLLIWIAVVIGFFSFSTRQEYYTLPALPAFAILGGRVLFDLELAAVMKTRANAKERSRISWARLGLSGHTALAAVGVAALAASAFVLIRIRGVVINGDISSALTKNPEYYALSLGHIFDLTPQSFAALRGPVIGAGLALALGSVIALIAYTRRRVIVSALSIAGMMALLFFWAHESLKVFEPYLSSKALAFDVLRRMKPGDKIVLNGEYESGSTMNFYTRQPVYMLNHRSSNLEFGSYLPGAPRRFFDDAEFRAAWTGDARIFLHTELELKQDIINLLSPAPVYELEAAGDKAILSNKE
jgi:4-amino-4-deoxy-L-arabinose transferase-like glycosyltransferase